METKQSCLTPHPVTLKCSEKTLVINTEPTLESSIPKLDRPTVSILKPVQTVASQRIPATSTTQTASINRTGDTPKLSMPSFHKENPHAVVSKPDALSYLLSNPSSSKSEVLLAVANLAEKHQQQSAMRSDRKILLRNDQGGATVPLHSEVVGFMRSANVTDRPTGVSTPHLPHNYGPAAEQLIILENGSQIRTTGPGRVITTAQGELAEHTKRHSPLPNDRLVAPGHTYLAGATKPSAFNTSSIPARVAHKDVVTVHVPPPSDVAKGSTIIKLHGNGSQISSQAAKQISLHTQLTTGYHGKSNERSSNKASNDSTHHTIPTNLPPVTIINSQYIKSKVATVSNKMPSVVDGTEKIVLKSAAAETSPVFTRSANSTLPHAAQSVTKHLLGRDISPTSQTPVNQPIIPTNPSNPSPESKFSEMKTDRKPNGIVVDKEAEMNTNSTPLSITTECNASAAAVEPLISPTNGQRKSGRNRTLKSPDPDVYSIASLAPKGMIP